MIALPPLAQGTTFASDYRIVELLSHTNHLALYGAVHLPTGEMRVLELLFSPVVPGSAFRDRFARAATDTARASAIPASIVPRIFEAGIDTTSQVPFVAMEPFRGEVLAAAATRTGGMPVADAMDILGQIVSGLGQLHAAGIVHGGLRPEVVVLTASPTQRPGVKLLNAALAQVLGDARVAVAPSAPPCDPSWAAPEQIRGDAATLASDVYSFALLAFTVLTGHRIWRGNVEAGLVREATKDAMPIPTTRAYELGRGGTLPTTFDGWFARAASRDPYARHANVHEAFVDLQAAFHRAAMAYTGSIGAMTSAQIMVPPPPRSSSKGILIAAGVFGGVIALGASFIALGVGYQAVARYKERATESRLAEERRVAQTKTSSGEVEAETAKANVTAEKQAESAEAAGDPPSVDIGSLPSASRRRGRESAEAKVDAPKSEAKVDAPKSEAKVDAPKSEAKVDAPSNFAGAKVSTTEKPAEIATSAPTSPASLLDNKPTSATTTKLQIIDLSPGKGRVVKSGDKITVRYTAKRQSDGVAYDTSHTVAPYSFGLGQGKVTKGWEQGIPGMKVGGKRRLVVPPQLGYGEKGLGGAVPPNAALIFDIELVSVDG